jgi:hypothetical protein
MYENLAIKRGYLLLGLSVKFDAEYSTAKMKFVQVFIVLTIAIAFVSARKKCTYEPEDCKYNTNGGINTDKTFLVRYIDGLKCKDNKQIKIIRDEFGSKWACCNPKGKWI